MDGFDAKHVVGWSVFGMAIIALAGGIAINRVLVIGIEATKAKQVLAAQAISGIHRRTNTWPTNQADAMLTADDRDRLHAANATFRLQKVEAPAHRALYVVDYDGQIFRLTVPEKM